MRSSGDGGNARDGLLAVGSIQGGDEDHMDDIEEEEKAQGCGERNNSNRGIGILPRNLGAEEDVCKGLGDEAMVLKLWEPATGSTGGISKRRPASALLWVVIWWAEHTIGIRHQEIHVLTSNFGRKEQSSHKELQ
ncbi:uncharacterized protein [Triticum aestivum]|uniref:uncharacterized protein isoform X5 n=1 Tax=Triticum aestivum TaxID=4565 RepID=UPI001D00CDD0|nr:uncharacterized protein LOC123053613 isoform X5 [Triticum aestivum]XP_044333041.1 uncharacterized protein LOC123053615 isoform X5 [Triticum aestivum]